MAGAWMAPPEGQSIWSQAVGERGGENFYESSLYWEAPTDNSRMAWTGSTWVGQHADNAPGEDKWRGEASFALKTELAKTDHASAAAQVGAIWRSDPADGCGEGGIEARAMAGRSFDRDGRTFANAEIAARAHAGGCASTRIDLSAGFRPDNDWLAIGQVFSSEPRGGDMAVHAQVSLVRFDRGGRGLQIGLRTRLDGDEPETALVIGLWGRGFA